MLILNSEKAEVGEKEANVSLLPPQFYNFSVVRLKVVFPAHSDPVTRCGCDKDRGLVHVHTELQHCAVFCLLFYLTL